VSAPPYLPEVPEGEADGLVAQLYEDIRRVLGLPLVNLVYRRLAVEPGQLESVWSRLRPNLADQAVDEGAEALVGLASIDVPRLSPASLRVLGLPPDALGDVASTLDAYNDANPRNLIALLALLHGVAGTGRPRPVSRGAAARRLLPQASLTSLDEPVRELLDEMARAVTPHGEQILVPSLFRHLAQHPGVLALAWSAVRPAVEGRAVARRANVVARRAADLAAALPHPVEAAADPDTTAVLRRFVGTIPRMIVVGVAFRAVLHAPAPVPHPPSRR
jgi:hypothetical protein